MTMSVLEQFGFSTMFPFSFLVKNNVKCYIQNETLMKQKYRMHKNYVESRVPKDDLLVWNVKVSQLCLVPIKLI